MQAYLGRPKGNPGPTSLVFHIREAFEGGQTGNSVRWIRRSEYGQAIDSTGMNTTFDVCKHAKKCIYTASKCRIDEYGLRYRSIY